jgi:hypothetical protein
VTDQSETLNPQPLPPGADGSGVVVAPAAPKGHSPAEIAAERPELAVGAAFAGGFLLAMILKRFAR